MTVTHDETSAEAVREDTKVNAILARKVRTDAH